MKFIINLFLFLLFSFNIIKPISDEPIFILHSYHPEFRWTTFESNGIRSALFKEKYKGNIYIEYLDTKNFDYNEMAPICKEVIEKKYRKFDFKIVVCTDNDALTFVKTFGDQLFPNAYFVFCGINGFEDSMVPDRNKYTGVAEFIDFEANIEGILKVFPNTKEIVSFFDGTISGQQILKDYQNAISKFNDRGIKFSNIINPTIAELLDSVSVLKDGQILLQGELGKDRIGEVHNHMTISMLLSQVSRVPIWGTINDMLRKGIIGGNLYSAFYCGRNAGEIIVEILNGKTPSQIPIVKKIPHYVMFDYFLLKRFNVDQSRLPKGSKIINKPVTIWQTNKPLLIKIGLAFVAMIIIIFILLYNISRRKKAEYMLKESKMQLDRTLSSISDCVWSIDFDKNGNLLNTFFSPVIEKIYGFSVQYLKEDVTRWRKLIIEEDQFQVNKIITELKEGDLEYAKFKYRMRTREGKLKWLEQSIKRTTTINNCYRFDGITTDITQSIEQEEIMLKYLKAVEQSPVSIIITNTIGEIEYVNPYFEKISGYSYAEIKGKNPRILKTGFTPETSYSKLWETISSGNEWQGEFLNRKKNGEYYWEVCSISPIKNDEGVITHFVAVKEDITHLKEVEQELRKAKENAEKADKLKDEFLAQMSHEIRTPVNSILNFSDMLREELSGKIDEDLEASFPLIVRAGNRLIRTVDSLINMAELQTGFYTAKFVEIDPEEKIRNLIRNDFMKTAQDKKLFINFNYNSSIKKIVADEYSFEMIFKNLIDNALKYTYYGGVEVIVADNEKDWLEIKVKDSGIGISEEYLGKLFEPFSQEEQGYTRRFEGNGLGLAIIKKFLTLNNAKISVESKKGEGTTFTVLFNKQTNKVA